MADGCFGILFFFTFNLNCCFYFGYLFVFLVFCLFYFFRDSGYSIVWWFLVFFGCCFFLAIFCLFVCLFLNCQIRISRSFFLFSIHRDKNDYNPFQLIDNVDHQIIIYTLSIIVIVLYSQVLFWKLILFLVVVYYSQKKQKTKNEDFFYVSTRNIFP